MWTYNAPLQDMHFVIEEVLQAPATWAQTPAFEDLDFETSRQILEEAGKFANGVLAPINSTADLEGCKWVDGNVTTPAGYPAVYKAYVDGGWPALACDPAYGGQGLPQLLNAALNEIPGHDRQHRPPGAVPPARCAGGQQRLVADGGAQVFAGWLVQQDPLRWD